MLHDIDIFKSTGFPGKGAVVEEIRLVKVHSTETEALKEYIEALYRLDEDYDSIVNIEEGVKSLMRNEMLATAYFIKRGDERVGYVILTRYHAVERGGLTIYIDELYVASRKRRSGIGRAIMEQIIEIARAQSAKALWVQFEPYNSAAEAFFQSQGFKSSSYKNFEFPL
ncbi:MAG: GNAT family N-acetyltransferase [Deltaproteobacteria bacterium]|nr:GNAT family N-acetyltransferase [Deltaproteobacteria bacterium]